MTKRFGAPSMCLIFQTKIYYKKKRKRREIIKKQNTKIFVQLEDFRPNRSNAEPFKCIVVANKLPRNGIKPSYTAVAHPGIADTPYLRLGGVAGVDVLWTVQFLRDVSAGCCVRTVAGINPAENASATLVGHWYECSSKQVGVVIDKVAGRPIWVELSHKVIAIPW